MPSRSVVLIFILIAACGTCLASPFVSASVSQNLGPSAAVCSIGDVQPSHAFASSSCVQLNVNYGFVGQAYSEADATFGALRAYAFSQLEIETGTESSPYTAYVSSDAVAHLDDTVSLPADWPFFIRLR